jgi:hypothetical protein
MIPIIIKTHHYRDFLRCIPSIRNAFVSVPKHCDIVVPLTRTRPAKDDGKRLTIIIWKRPEGDHNNNHNNCLYMYTFRLLFVICNIIVFCNNNGRFVVYVVRDGVFYPIRPVYCVWIYLCIFITNLNLHVCTLYGQMFFAHLRDNNTEENLRWVLVGRLRDTRLNKFVIGWPFWRPNWAP